MWAVILTWIFLGCQPPGTLGSQTLINADLGLVGFPLESEQFVRGTFPSDLHKGKNEKFLATWRSQGWGWFPQTEFLTRIRATAFLLVSLPSRSLSLQAHLSPRRGQRNLSNTHNLQWFPIALRIKPKFFNQDFKAPALLTSPSSSHCLRLHPTPVLNPIAFQ